MLLIIKSILCAIGWDAKVRLFADVAEVRRPERFQFPK